MADHVRKQIRDAAVAALTNLTTTGARVFASRTLPIGAVDLPSLCIYTPSDTVLEATIHQPPTYEREIALTVEGHVKTTAEEVDAVLDRIAVEVERALALGLLGRVPVFYAGADLNFDDSTDKPVGVITMNFTARAFTVANAPDVLS